MKITGHKTEAVYRRYAIVNEADVAEGLERLAGFLALLRVRTFCTFRTEHRHLTATSGLLEPCRPRAGTLRNQESGGVRVLMGSLEHGSSKNPSPL